MIYVQKRGNERGLYTQRNLIEPAIAGQPFRSFVWSTGLQLYVAFAAYRPPAIRCSEAIVICNLRCSKDQLLELSSTTVGFPVVDPRSMICHHLPLTSQQ